jgi:outer membrane protein assembly factor BamA
LRSLLKSVETFQQEARAQRYLKVTFKALLLLCLAVFNKSTFAQFTQHLCVLDSLSERNKTVQSVNSASLVDSLLQKKLLLVMTEGYLDARIDTLTLSDTLYATVHRGQLFQIGTQEYLLDSNTVRYVENNATTNLSQPWEKEALLNMHRRVFSDFENTGYPFVHLSLHQVGEALGKINLTWQIHPGPIIVMDTLLLQSEDPLPKRFLTNYISYKRGSLYSEKYIQSIPNRIKELSFIQQTRPPQVIFSTQKADLVLSLKKKKANYFNGVVGVQPVDGGGVVITGDAEIKLVNALNRGEDFELNWRRIQEQTQDFQARTSYPYLFNSPVGLDAGIRIYRRDSTFASFKTNIGGFLPLGGNNRLKIYYENNRSTTLASPASSSDLRNVTTRLYNLSMVIEKLDYRFNPRKGLRFEIDAGTGKRGSSVPSSDSLVASVKNTSVYRLSWNSENYLPLFKRQTLRIANFGAWYSAPDIARNELYRIGGFKTIRGINEEDIFASAWTVFSLEYRFILEQNSALFLFADQAWYEQRTVSQFITDTPLGFGAGVNFETKSGIFTFTYALAQQFDNPILFRNARISFGFRNLF